MDVTVTVQIELLCIQIEDAPDGYNNSTSYRERDKTDFYYAYPRSCHSEVLLPGWSILVVSGLILGVET